MAGTSDLGTFGRYTELPLDKMTADQWKAYEFTMKERGQAPGPYTYVSLSLMAYDVPSSAVGLERWSELLSRGLRQLVKEKDSVLCLHKLKF